MSEILFKSLKIENFLSIGEGGVDLDSRGLLLIQGVNDDDPSANSNGAGKSSVVDALCWSLYGTTARGQSGDRVVNRFEGKNCRVETTFAFNGKTYAVTRHRKHSSGKNRLLFACEGDDLTLGTDKLTQELIEKTIGCSLEVFTASIYAGQNRMPNLPAMTDKELKQLVEEAAGIEVLDAAYGIARERLRTIQNTEAASITKYDAAHNALSTARTNLDSTKARKVEWDEQHKRSVEEMTKKLSEDATAIKQLKGEIAAMDEDGCRARVKELEEQLLAAQKPQETLTPPERPEILPEPAVPKERNDIRVQIAGLERDRDAARRTVQNAVASIKSIDKLVGTPCGECGKEYHGDDLEGRRASLTREARDAKAEFDRLNAELDLLERILHGIDVDHTDAVEAVRAENAKRRAEYEQAQEAHKNALQAQRDAQASSDSAKIMDALRSAQIALQNVSNSKTRLDALLTALRSEKARLDKLRAEENPIAPLIEKAERAVVEAEAEVAEAKRQLDAAVKAVEDATVVAEMFSPKGMRGEVLDSVTPFLNARTSQYLGALSDGSISAEWKTVGETGKGELREKFHIAVSNEHGSEDYEGLSGGEQRKVRISTAMALQDLVASRADRPIKLFIADEVDDALDVSGMERLMGVLDDKARAVGTVLVISHNDLGDWISEQITVMKSGGKSHIVEL